MRALGPGLFCDPASAVARFVLVRTSARRPALSTLLASRSAALVGVDLAPGQERRAVDAQLTDAVERAVAAWRELQRTETPVIVAGTSIQLARALRGLRLRPSLGVLLGTAGSGEGGAIFVSNVDDTVIASEAYDDALALLRRTLDDELGPQL